MTEDITPITIHFPDAETKQQFIRWWNLRGDGSMKPFVEGSLNRIDAPYLYTRFGGDMLILKWDVIPF